MINYDEIKRLNLSKFILNGRWGYKLCKQKSCRSYAVLKNTSNTLLVKTKPSKNTSYYYFKNLTDDSIKGTIIDFLKQENLNINTYFKGTTLPLVVVEDEDEEKEDEVSTYSIAQIEAKLLKFKHYSTYNYLLERKIGKQVITDFVDGKKDKTNKYSAVFSLYSNVDNLLNGQLTGLNFNYSPLSNYLPGEKRCFGTPKGLSVLKNGDFKKLFICESPIDALSLESVLRVEKYTPTRAYLATCGRLSHHQITNLKALMLDSSGSYEIVLAFDNDAKGREYADILRKETALDIKAIFPPNCKDWNEYLKSC